MAQSQPLLGQTVSHYHIIGKLGVGGMGVVYKAEDLSLGRHVALKFLPDDLARNGQALERFRREARAASALNHPNICTIYEIGQQSGQPFLAMEFIDGQTLKHRIARGPLPFEELLKVSIQVASALGAAHAKGIIHRDIKPANVMIADDGQVKLLDFGLAKLTESAEHTEDGETRTLWTQTGAIVGTVSYMSPEQVEGKPVDARSDIFSFGVVLYEMLTGQRAFQRDSHLLNRAVILRDEPPPREVASAVPPELQRIVTRCMRKKLSERFQSIADVRQALEDLRNKVLKPETEPSIAVLPFTNPSADKENEYFSDGLAEEIINALTRVPGLRVTARTSAFSFRNKELDIRRIGEALNARTILQGSVRRAGNWIRIIAQLINAGDGYHLWSERYDREMTDVLVVQEEIAQAIVDKLKGQLAVSDKRPLVQQHPASFRAWQYYWEGRNHQYRFTPDGLSRGKGCFERAIREDPHYALPYVGLAVHYNVLANLALVPPNDVLPKAKAMVQQALRCEGMLGEAHAAAGVTAVLADYEWTAAERAFRRALELNPASSSVHHMYAFWWLRPQGRLQEALVENQLALELDPLSPFLRVIQGYTLFLAQQYQAATEFCEGALGIDESCYLAYQVLGRVHQAQGRLQEAIHAGERAVQISGNVPVERGLLAAYYGLAGRHEEARQILESLQELGKTHYVPATSVAGIWLGLGECDRAWQCLEKAVGERDPGALQLKTDPIFEALHGDRHYTAILEKMGLT